MARVFTNSLIQDLQFNLNTSIGQELTLFNPESPSTSESPYAGYYFQLLIFEDLENKPQLVCGTQAALIEKYRINSKDLPSSGVNVNEKFTNKEEKILDPMARIKLGTVQFLLQTRKISQLIAYTWLEEIEMPTEIKENIKLVRKVFKSYGANPDTYWIENNLLMPVSDINTKISEIKDQDCFFDYFIKPENIGYQSITLALLLCGHAYYKQQDGTYSRIWEPIAAVYQFIVEYCIDISWDSFYGTTIELIKTGKQKQSPANKVIIPYPPRPSEFDLSQKEIKDWATAEIDGGLYPFYPTEETQEWKDSQPQYVAPPTSYIPLSCL